MSVSRAYLTTRAPRIVKNNTHGIQGAEHLGHYH